MPRERRLRVLTWYVHGNYLYYLSHAPHEFHVVTDGRNTPGYAGLGNGLPWGANVHGGHYPPPGQARVAQVALYARPDGRQRRAERQQSAEFLLVPPRPP